MARRNRKMSKLEPAVETLTFDLGNTAVAGQGPGVSPGHSTYYVDISQSASLYNRKFFRQGLQWAASGLRINSQAVAPGTEVPDATAALGGVIISKLPQNWIMSNSWEKGFRAWQKMNRKAMSENESLKPRFLDFKIYMDDKHHELGFGANKLPVVTDYGNYVGGMTQAEEGEWVHSTVHIPNTAVDSSDPASNNPRSVIAVGANYQGIGADGNFAVSLVEGYAASRGLPNILDPNTPADAASVNQSTAQNWMAALDNDFDQQEGLVLEDMTSENNIAPYPFENDGNNVDTMYPGGANQLTGPQIHCIEPITGSTVGGVTYIKGGTFPCGLIRIDIYNNNTELEMNTQLQLDLVAGPHRGYLAEAMTEM